MNPFKQYKNFIIGKALANTDDVFEKARIEMLYSFTNFFFFTGLLFSVAVLNRGIFEPALALVGIGLLGAVLVVLKTSSNVNLAVWLYMLDQTIQTIFHVLFGDGVIGIQEVSWSFLYVLFTYLFLGRKWGLLSTLLTMGIIVFGLADEGAGFIYFQFPGYIHQQKDVPYIVLMPFLLSVYLVDQFVKARKKAEAQISEQKSNLEMKNKDITDSIMYAKKIQYAVLPNEETIIRSIPLSFIFYKPKDIVSGDFYWFHEIDRDNYIIVCADCTGHGVPGALMTVIGSSLLNQTVIDNKNTQPSQILLILDNLINITLKQQKEHLHFVQDGMDIALIHVNKAKKELTFTSAKRPALFIHNKELTELKGTKHALGGSITDCKVFKETKINYSEDDIIYLFTDGITDQFGGEKGKKFGIQQLRELMIKIHLLPMAEQKVKLENILEQWQGSLEQVDDIQLIGIRF